MPAIVTHPEETSAVRVIAIRPSRHARMTSLDLVQAPIMARRAAQVLWWLFALVPIGLVFIPWQQNLSATGRVIAYDPAERQQILEAPVEGRIVKWYHREGEQVRGPRLARRTVLKPEDLVVLDPPDDVKPGDVLRVEVLDDNDQPRVEERRFRAGDRLVQEDRVVEAGEIIVSIRDPNMHLTADLARERQAIEERLTQARERASSISKQIEALRGSQENALKAARNRLEMGKKRLEASREAVRAARKTLELADENHGMQQKLFDKGLASKLEFLTASQRKEVTDADWRRAQQAELAAADEVQALEAELIKARNDTDAALQAAQALQQQAQADAFAASRDLIQIKVRQRRQDTQDVTAPCDGTIFRVLANASQGGAFVKTGDPLVVLIPEVKAGSKRVAELFVDGNDAPLITELWRERVARGEAPDIKVRLQFEGWPAIQWVGWPSVAVGTFGGQIVSVDAHDDGKGRFRILVEPDPMDDPWPKDFSLRQGVRATGWVLLNRVTLGWELWRRLNGFPPVVAAKEPDESAGGKSASKIKLPK